MVRKRPSSRPIVRKSIPTDVAKRKAKRKEDRRAKKRRVVKATTTASDDDDDDEYTNDEPHYEGGTKKTNETKSKKKKTIDSTSTTTSSSSSSSSSSSKKKRGSTNTDFYSTIDPSIAAALRNDDEEIARLEQDLGLTSGSKQKKKLHKEYAKLEGYGDDFGDFLDGIDGMLGRIETGEGDGEPQDSGEESDYDSDECEELIPMKDPAGVDEYDIQVSSDSSEEDDDDDNNNENDDDGNSSSSNDNDDDTSDNAAQSSSDDDDDEEEEDNPKRRTIRDHNIKDTYVPSVGQDLYGNTIAHDGDDEGSQPKKYIPPHLRTNNAAPDSGSTTTTTSGTQDQHKHQDQHALAADNEDRANTLRTLQRLLNNNLNRLSDNTLESVTQSITSLYSSSNNNNNKKQQQQQFSTQDINHYFWKNIRAACVASHVVLSGLIPVYLACAAGVHYQTSGSGGGGGSVGFGAYLLESVVLDLWEVWKTRREEARGGSGTTTKGMTPARQDTGRQEDDDDDDAILHGNKEGSNLILLLCYLYNYGVIHCTIMYDVVRHLIEHFTEGDIELLLIILSHCGHQLRSDDPSALKDIVLSVKDRSLLGVGNTENGSPPTTSSSSSRALHMIDAITDLKNNRKRKNDTTIREKTLGYRKVIGRMKSIVTLRSKGDRVVDSNGLRITLKDILDIQEKGRWWKVGASWTGTQFRRSGSGSGGENDETTNDGSVSVVDSEQQIQRSSSSSNDKANDKQHQKLLKLATKQRMNTPTRRTIFCIIMSSDDCQDAFQKLLAAKLFQGGGGGGSDTSSERDVVRVIVHCCGSEKVYNPYYSHLATRVCELRSGCRFTFQLTFWDAFKQFGGGSGGGMRARKAANLAKMLAHLLIAGRLGLNVLKVIDISPDGGMPEAAIVFLTILFSTIFEELDDSSQVSNIFKKVGSSGSGANGGGGSETNIEDDEDDNVLAVVDEREALKESISVFLLHFMKEHPHNIKKSQFRKNFKVAVKACDTDGLDFMM